MVTELVNKFWSKELDAVKLRNEGNRLYSRGQVSASLAKYSEAMELGNYKILQVNSLTFSFYPQLLTITW